MRNIISVAFLAVVVAFALTLLISPEEPDYIAYHTGNNNNNKNAVRFVGGDHKTMLTGFWYFPNSNNNNANTTTGGYPVILLAHGMGLIQGKSLNSFVDAFQSAGYAVVTFDYATFGKSEGFPRHQICPQSHVADVQAALSMIQKEGKKRGNVIDGTRIGLWGTSLGGGHVLMAAAAATADSSVRAVVSQVPALASGFESVLGSLINTPVESTKGVVMVTLGLMKYYIYWRMSHKITYFPIVGPPGSAALLQNPGDEQGYLGILNPAADDTGWKNAATTNSALHLMFSRPLNTVANITVPVLLIAAEQDTLCPATYIQVAKERIPNAEIIIIPSAGHFDVYTGDELQIMLSAQVKFFNLHLN